MMTTRRSSSGNGLPTWFPLATYDTQLSLEHWLGAFVMRMAVKAKWENARNLGREEHESTFLSAVANDDQPDSSGLLDIDRPKRLWPIQEPSVLQILYAAAIMKTGEPHIQSHIAALPTQAEKFMGSMFSKASEALSGISFGEVGDHSDWPNVVGGRWALATIDLDQDDETLEYIFKGWLAGCREALGRAAPRPFDETDAKKWSTYQVLAAFDLKHWSSITETKLTDAQMGRALWDRPGMNPSDVDLTERYRKTVKPMLDEIFSWNYIMRLWRQLELLKAIDVVVAKKEGAAASE